MVTFSLLLEYNMLRKHHNFQNTKVSRPFENQLIVLSRLIDNAQNDMDQMCSR